MHSVIPGLHGEHDTPRDTGGAGNDSSVAKLIFPSDILLVEDEPALRAMLSQFLEHAGYSVHVVADGREALNHLEKNPTRLIVTDIFMPENDGFELLTALRSRHRQVPVIAMSGGLTGDSEQPLKTARLLGAECTLTKPFPMQALFTAVHAAIGFCRAESEIDAPGFQADSDSHS